MWMNFIKTRSRQICKHSILLYSSSAHNYQAPWCSFFMLFSVKSKILQWRIPIIVINYFILINFSECSQQIQLKRSSNHITDNSVDCFYHNYNFRMDRYRYLASPVFLVVDDDNCDSKQWVTHKLVHKLHYNHEIKL